MVQVLIFGTFDILHPGHLFLFQEAKKHGTVYAVVALDETVLKVKQRPPYLPLQERMKNIEKYGIIAHAGDAHDKLKTFKELQPDTVVLGYDQKINVDALKKYILANEMRTKIIDLPAYHPEL